jgi:hypothetical protein
LCCSARESSAASAPPSESRHPAPVNPVSRIGMAEVRLTAECPVFGRASTQEVP